MSDVMLHRVAALIEAAIRHDGLLGEASAYHLRTGGSMWRARLALACSAKLRVADAGAFALAAACELIHQASVVHDDVQDGASIRRGEASVGARFGAPVAICVGDHLLMSAFRVLANAPDAASLAGLFASRVCDMAGGQAEEFSPTLWPTITRARYLALVEAKAGALVSLPVEGAAILGRLNADEISAARQFCRAVGVAYQLTDDIADFAADRVRGALNGVLVETICSSEPRLATSLRVALAHAAGGGSATHDATALMVSLPLAAEATLQWRDRLLAEAMQELAGHPLRGVLVNAAMALTPPRENSLKVSQDAA